MIAAVIAIGTIPGWLTLIALAVLGYFIVRGGGGQALNVLEIANRVLTNRVSELEHDLAEAKIEIADLRKTHTMEPIIEAIRVELASAAALMQAEHKAIMEGLAANTSALKGLETSLQGLAMFVHAKGDSSAPERSAA